MVRLNETMTVVILVAATALAGCTGDDVRRETPDDRGVELGGEPFVSDVTIDITLANATVGERATVCWTVSGSGRVAHVDVHVDPLPRALATGPRPLDGFQYFPDNETTHRDGGYLLPSTFCTDIEVDRPGTWFVQGHASRILDDPGRLSSAIMWNVTDGEATATTEGTRDEEGPRGENATETDETPLQTRLP